LASAALAAGSAGTAAAKDLRYPEAGAVAFLLHLPIGWETKSDSAGNLLVIAPDHSAALSLTVAHEDATSLKQTPDEYANATLAAVKAGPFNKHEKGAIAGIPADSYYGRVINPSNLSVLAQMNVIKPGHDYIIVETILTAEIINRTQRAELATVLKGITLTGVTANQTRAEAPLNLTHSKAPPSPTRAKTATRTEAPADQNRANPPSNPTHAEASSNPARIEVPLKSLGGTFVVPVFINGAITLNFVVDSGAADVSVPADVVGTLIRAGTIGRADFTGKQKYMLADGSVSPTITFIIWSLKVGDVLVENVKRSVSPAAGSLLLGQSFLQRFKSWSMDNTKHVLVLEQN